jgi:hypothetical protein
MEIKIGIAHTTENIRLNISHPNTSLKSILRKAKVNPNKKDIMQIETF